MGDFLAAAHAMVLEQRGETRQAAQVLAAIVPRHNGEMTLTHQWLPDLVRLAIATGDRQIARTAARACQEEAAAETRPAGRPPPACGAKDSSTPIRSRSGTPSCTTGRQARSWSCLPRWRTWRPCWPGAASTRRPGPR